jgi:hypothetical protein
MKKAAVARDRKQGRRSGSSAGQWWLTPVLRDTCCAKCAGLLRRGKKDMVYRHRPREALCIDCAEDLGVSFRPSARWEERRLRRRKLAA